MSPVCSQTSPSASARSACAVSAALFQYLAHQLRRPQKQLALITRPERAQPGLDVDDTRFDVGQGHADRADLRTTAQRVHQARHHALGERVALDNPAAGERLELFLGRLHQRHRARERDLDRGEVHLARADDGAVEHRLKQRGHAEHEGRACRLDGLQHVGQVARVRHQRQRAAAGQAEPEGADVGVHVKHRKRHQNDVRAGVELGFVPRVQLQPRVHIGLVLAHHALGRARRSAACQDHGVVVGAHGRADRLLAAVRAHQVA